MGNGQNTETMFGTDGEIDELGDRDTYVIYPTTEKSLYRPGFYVAYQSEGNLKNRESDCTKVFGFDKADTLEFRLDDPMIEDHKSTDDDEECAFQVDGWELIWWLGDAYMKDTVETVDDVILTSLEIHFSRKDRRVAICPYDDSNKQGGIDAGDFDGTDLILYWQQLAGTCADITNSCIYYDVECPDLVNEMKIDDYLEN